MRCLVLAGDKRLKFGPEPSLHDVDVWLWSLPEAD